MIGPKCKGRFGVIGVGVILKPGGKDIFGVDSIGGIPGNKRQFKIDEFPIIGGTIGCILLFGSKQLPGRIIGL